MPWVNTGKALFAQGLTCYWSSVTASFYATLVRASYVPAESHIYCSAFSGSELSSISFVAGYGGTGRISLTGRIANINQVSNQLELQLNTLIWAGLSAGTPAMVVYFAQSGSDALSPLLGWSCQGGFGTPTNGTNFTLSYGSAGCLTITD